MKIYLDTYKPTYVNCTCFYSHECLDSLPTYLPTYPPIFTIQNMSIIVTTFFLAKNVVLENILKITVYNIKTVFTLFLEADNDFCYTIYVTYLHDPINAVAWQVINSKINGIKCGDNTKNIAR